MKTGGGVLILKDLCTMSTRYRIVFRRFIENRITIQLRKVDKYCGSMNILSLRLLPNETACLEIYLLISGFVFKIENLYEKYV